MSGLRNGVDPHRRWTAADVRVTDGNGPQHVLAPRMNFYERSTNPIGSPAIRSAAFEDLYLTLLAFNQAGPSASFNAWIFPMVSWILVEPALLRARRAVSPRGRSAGRARADAAERVPRAEQGAQPRSGSVTRRGLSIGLSLAAVTAVLLFVLARGFGRDPHEVPFQLRGKPAPDFTLRRLDTGAPVKLSDLRGKPIVINFWASWCGPCKMEHPVVAMAARRYGQEFQFYGVVFEDTEENARVFAGSPDPSFPQLVDERSRMAVDYGVTGVPETYFIDAQGILRDKVASPIDPRTMMEKLATLKQPAGPVSEVVR